MEVGDGPWNDYFSSTNRGFSTSMMVGSAIILHGVFAFHMFSGRHRASPLAASR